MKKEELKGSSEEAKGYEGKGSMKGAARDGIGVTKAKIDKEVDTAKGAGQYKSVNDMSKQIGH
jgi:hypothetical protein